MDFALLSLWTMLGSGGSFVSCKICRLSALIGAVVVSRAVYCYRAFR